MDKTLVICEKPAQAGDYAKVLGIAAKRDGYYELKNGWRVTWARGHLFELVEPQEYDEKWGGRWNWGQLPMIPPEFKSKIADGKGPLVKVIKSLLKDTTRVIIATDAAREGELIGREILAYCKYKGKIDRLWAKSMVASDIAAAFAKLRPGSETEALYEAALARRSSDWLSGLPMTRAVSLAANVRGEYYPVGRIQTPVLALVVRRDKAIKAFKTAAYYELEATVQSAGGKTFKMWYAPPEEKRIKEKAAGEKLLKQAQGACSPLKVEKKAGKEAPPLPYNLPELQMDCNRILGLTAKRTLEVAQELYDKKAITYPRTDCRYFASEVKSLVEGKLAVIARHFPDGVAKLRDIGILLRDTTFDDKQLTDHDALAPTSEFIPLSGIELQVFTLISQQFLRAICIDCLFDTTKVSMDANGVPFTATGKAIRVEGWRGLKLRL